jgi:hypothetical protein
LGEGEFGMEDKTGFSNDAVNAFFLDSRQTTQIFIADVLPKTWGPDFMSFEMDCVLVVAEFVIDLECWIFLR